MSDQAKTIHAVLLDPATKGIDVIEISTDLQSLYDVLDCQRVSAVQGPVEDSTVWVDGEGLFATLEGDWVTMLQKSHSPLAGRLLIAGRDPDSGEMSSIDLDVIAEMLRQIALVWAPEQASSAESSPVLAAKVSSSIH